METGAELQTPMVLHIFWRPGWQFQIDFGVQRDSKERYQSVDDHRILIHQKRITQYIKDTKRLDFFCHKCLYNIIYYLL